jgi:hypothetical protein
MLSVFKGWTSEKALDFHALVKNHHVYSGSVRGYEAVDKGGRR